MKRIGFCGADLGGEADSPRAIPAKLAKNLIDQCGADDGNRTRMIKDRGILSCGDWVILCLSGCAFFYDKALNRLAFSVRAFHPSVAGPATQQDVWWLLCGPWNLASDGANMPTIKLTKTAVDSATPLLKDCELRDTLLPGLLVKVTRTCRKVFMVQYRTNAGERHKPAIGRFGELTVEQARSIARDWLADVRKGKDPSAEKSAARTAPTMRELCNKFLEDYSRPKNSVSTAKSNLGYINRYILPSIGSKKVREVTRDVSELVTRLNKHPVTENRVLSCLRKMFNMAEVWGFRDDGTNPCRHISKYRETGKTRLITDEEMMRIFAYLDRAETEGVEHPFVTLAVRLQFAFAARMSEIIGLEWAWVDFANRRVVWPDSKTGEISKPMSEESFALLTNAPRLENSPYVIPSIFDPRRPMPHHTYALGWRRIQERAGVAHIGTHGIRHRSTTDIANSGIPVKVGMALTAHKSVTVFMRYVHTEDDPIRAAAEAVAQRR
ncbi:tyrosine-type recombinase/integrase [Methylocapsa acidiphila]|uniref:tyrosine-type recombinase/integrase n=1 Tax=Methylocapsa acidiphila TaxID=133552 RepID=UPI003CC91267